MNKNKLTLTETCKLLGISLSTAYRRIADGTLVPIPGVKRKPFMFSRPALEALAGGDPGMLTAGQAQARAKSRWDGYVKAAKGGIR